MLNVLKNKNIIISMFLLLTITSIFIMHNVFNKKEVEKVFEENKVNKKQFAMYVKDSTDDSYTEYTDSELFPNSTKYSFNVTESYCIDNKDNIVSNAISYSDGKVTVTSNKTIYCYLYFDLNENYFSDHLMENKPNGLNTTLEGGLYRFQGTSVDNYLCFGTSDKDTCLNNTDIYMYRIIGLTNDGKIKVIKNRALGNGIKWYENAMKDYIWPDSTIFLEINQDAFLTNDNYMPKDWGERIETISWKYGDINDINMPASALYNIENSLNNIISAKVGLMYIHDYYYAYQSGGLNCSSEGAYSTCVNSWINLKKCDENFPSDYEWTMSRYGASGSYYYAYAVVPYGYIKYYYEYFDFSVRPVFFLKSDMEYVSGTGINSDPFIITFGGKINEDDGSIDTTPPTNNSVTINSGVEETNSTNVTLTLSSTGATEMCISNTSTCDSWETYATSKSYTLSSGDGTKIVYVWYRDEYGNASEYVIDSIILDTPYLIENPTKGLNTTIEGGLYRYQGESGTVDNYICFGISDKDICLNNTDEHMYRIIGITEDGKIKVMKNYALNTAYYWHNTYLSNTPWPNSDLYKGLNGISGGKYSNLIIGNTLYMPSGWEEKIETTAWKYGDNTNGNVTADALYNTENEWINTINVKIGLIYAHDYYYSLQSGGLNCGPGSGAYTTCKTSWMHLSKCDSEAPSGTEWTMSRQGIMATLADGSNFYGAWHVYSDGGVGYDILNVSNSVRPVFFLKSSVEFIGGTGTASDPFIIS